MNASRVTYLFICSNHHFSTNGTTAPTPIQTRTTQYLSNRFYEGQNVHLCWPEGYPFVYLLWRIQLYISIRWLNDLIYTLSCHRILVPPKISTTWFQGFFCPHTLQQSNFKTSFSLMPILVSVKKIHLQDDLRKDSRTMEFNALVNKVCQKMSVTKHQPEICQTTPTLPSLLFGLS